MIIGGTILERGFFQRNASVIFDLKFLARPLNVTRLRDSSVKPFFARRCAILDPNAWLLSLFPGASRLGVALKNIYPHTFGPVIRGKKSADYSSRGLHKTRTYHINGTF